MARLRRQVSGYRPPEGEEQKVVIEWARKHCRLPGIEMLHMMPNGSCFRRGDFVQWQWLHNMGFEPGLPDLYLDAPRGGYHGARIELKRRAYRPSEVSEQQLERHDLLRRQGYYVVVCGGAQAAIDEITAYLSERRQRPNM